LLEALAGGAEKLFTFGPLLGMAIMLPIALVSGLMPGGGLPVAVIVLGFAGHLDPWIAVTVVVFHMAASDITEPIPSILMGIPGSRTAQATILDGYPMAQKGLAGVALGASYTCTLVGGLIGALALLAVLPISRSILFVFGSAEFFLLALMGVIAVAVVSSGAFVKGMLTAAFGLGIATIGMTNIGGVVRATFGIDYLWDGIGIVPIVVGLFALPEAIDLVVGNTPIARERTQAMLADAKRDVYRGMLEVFNHKWLVVRSSLIGTFVGMMPGVGGSAAHWIAYAQARQTEKGARESFGRGDVRGVIAADAANNSSDGGVLIPTVVFGIPGSAGMSIVLAILVLSGIQPGPGMLNTHLDLTVSLVYTIALANIVVVPVVLLFAPWITRIAAVPPNILAPIIIGVVTLSAFQASAAFEDLGVVLAFGALGVFMKRYGWPRPPILIAVVLADILERYLWIAINTYGFSMFLRPQFLIIVGFMVLVIFFSLRVQKGARLVMAQALSASPPDKPADSAAPRAEKEGSRKADNSLDRIVSQRRFRLSLDVVGEVVLLLVVGSFFIYLFRESLQWGPGPALMPRIAVILGTPFLLIRVFVLLRRGKILASAPAAEIMDVGFRLGTDPKAEAGRFVRILSFIGILYLGIWLVGFHLAITVGVFLYLLIYGKAGWFWSTAISFLLLALIVGVYDWLLHTVWPPALIPSLLGLE
jgi:TctA family transporter